MIRAAIIGLGAWGQNLVRHVHDQSDVIRFTTAATRTPAKAEAFARDHGLRMFDDYKAVLASPEIDAVVLATPHSQHTDQIVAAAQAGKDPDVIAQFEKLGLEGVAMPPAEFARFVEREAQAAQAIADRIKAAGAK